MKKLDPLGIVLTALISISKLSQGQEVANKNFGELFCKEWRLQYSETRGKKSLPTSAQKKDRMIFYKDHRAKSIESDFIQEAVWSYDSTKALLIMVDNETKEKLTMKILKITNEQCVLEFTDPGGRVRKLSMAPVKKG